MSADVSRRTVLAVGAGAAFAAASSPSTSGAASPDPLLLNDASRLNPTPVARHWAPRRDDAQFIAQLRRELKDAASAGRPVAVGGARHSMGGQSLARGGTAVSLRAVRCEPDVAQGLYRVGAGTRWREVQATLDPLGFSPKVMQSNNDFSVAGTFSVNAHGWAVPFGPMGSTVRSARLMLADGSIVDCSPQRQSELFDLAMGGYGACGILLDLTVEMAPNVMLAPSYEVMPSTVLGDRFVRALAPGGGVRMAYGRLSLQRDAFLHEALLVTFRDAGKGVSTGSPRAEGEPMSSMTRGLYRAQVGSDAWKRARWYAETVIAPRLQNGPSARNTLLGQPVSALAERNPDRTDILHEYFVPPGRLSRFLQACREVVPGSGQDLLNVTLRYVGPDDQSVMAYAPGGRIAAVMSFSQAMTPAGEAGMRRMTEQLVERVLDLGGSFYLPYRLHARADQAARAYPGLSRFRAGKHRYDPSGLFRNALLDRYFG